MDPILGFDPILAFDYAGVAVFSATGALAASRKQLDAVSSLFLSCVTAIGGGTLRDVILNVPVFWVDQPGYLVVAAIAGIVVYYAAHIFESRYVVLLWLDAVGLAAYCVFGAFKGLTLTGSPTVAVAMGTLTATFGGIARDLMSNEPSVLLRPEIYVTAALAGAGTFTTLSVFGAPPLAAAFAGFLAAFAVRGGALRFGWAIRPYRSRPGRRPEDVL